MINDSCKRWWWWSSMQHFLRTVHWTRSSSQACWSRPARHILQGTSHWSTRNCMMAPWLPDVELFRKVEMRQARKKGRYVGLLPLESSSRLGFKYHTQLSLLPHQEYQDFSFRFNPRVYLGVWIYLLRTAAKEELRVKPRCRGSLLGSVHAPSFLTLWESWSLRPYKQTRINRSQIISYSRWNDCV